MSNVDTHEAWWPMFWNKLEPSHCPSPCLILGARNKSRRDAERFYLSILRNGEQKRFPRTPPLPCTFFVIYIYIYYLSFLKKEKTSFTDKIYRNLKKKREWVEAEGRRVERWERKPDLSPLSLDGSRAYEKGAGRAYRSRNIPVFPRNKVTAAFIHK